MGGGSAGDKRGREEVGAVDVALQQQKRLQATPLQSTQHQPHLQPTPHQAHQAHLQPTPLQSTQQQKHLQPTPLQPTQHQQPHLQPTPLQSTPPSVDNMDAHIDFLYRSAAMGRLKPAAQAI
jgi:hypothetical protein